jgi:histidine triad (HIT) family protein
MEDGLSRQYDLEVRVHRIEVGMSYDPQNVFARILRHELPCEQIFEDVHTLAFMDVMPQSDGHALVITREPAETLLELSPQGAAACIRTTQRIAAAVKRAFEVPGIMILQTNGAAAGQSVPHVHFHVIPRRSGEPLRLHATVQADPAQLRANAQRIRRCLAEPA